MTDATRTSPQKRVKRAKPKVLVPVMPNSDIESLLVAARLLAHSEPVLLLGIVPIEEGKNLSEGVKPARDLRVRIQKECDRETLRAKPRVRVSYTPWADIKDVLQKMPSIELLVLDHSKELSALKLTARDLLTSPPCDVAVIRGPLPEKPREILVPMRGGPHAERAVKMGLALAEPYDANVTTLRLHRADESETEQLGFAGLETVVQEIPQLNHQTVLSDDRVGSILRAAENKDIVVMGTAAHAAATSSSFGPIPDALFERCAAGVIAIKTKREVPETLEVSSLGNRAISILVDQWFAENTFHSNEFENLHRLAALKEERGVTISLALPTLNEEETVGTIIDIAKKNFMEDHAIIDEIVLIDSRSSDRTCEIAKSKGIPVFVHQDILPQHGSRPGKGEALWKSLYVTSGDIVIWCDTDVSNFDPRFIAGLIGPLLARTSLKFVKGFYRRPIKTGSGRLQAGRGGRVTELTARPLLNLFYPELSGIVQPLSGEYGGRREALENVTFTSGYGVETSVLIEIFEKYKLASIAQVDMIERVHNNQTLQNLSKMSFAIIQTVFARLEKRYGRALLEDVNRTMKLIRYEDEGFSLDVEEIAERERRPINKIPEYREKFGLDTQHDEQRAVANGSGQAYSSLYPTRAN